MGVSRRRTAGLPQEQKAVSLYRRTGSENWWCEFVLDGQRFRVSTRTANRTQAQEFEVLARNRAYNRLRLGHRPAIRWKVAAERWISESRKRSLDKDRAIIAWISAQFDADTTLQQIDSEVIGELRALKAEETSEATADRYMALLNSILRKSAGDWGLLDKAPKVPMYRPEVGEPRWLTHEEFRRLEKELPPHLRLAARFAVLTGLRMRAQLSLLWSQVDLRQRRAWVGAADMKGKRTHGFPLSLGAAAVLRAIRCRREDLKEPHVFLFRRKPYSDANGAAWRKATERAGLAGVRWHDLRHTWASWAVQSGVSLHEVMQLGGWRSLQMVQRYSHLAPGHLAAAAGKVRLGRKSPT
jgi:integrase